MPDLREFAPSNADGWGEVYGEVAAAEVRIVNIWDGESLLGTLDNESGTAIATLVVEDAGISRESGGRLYRPTLPLVDVSPL